jgi:hypothetical protein
LTLRSTNIDRPPIHTRRRIAIFGSVRGGACKRRWCARRSAGHPIGCADRVAVARVVSEAVAHGRKNSGDV